MRMRWSRDQHHPHSTADPNTHPSTCFPSETLLDHALAHHALGRHGESVAAEAPPVARAAPELSRWRGRS